MGKATVNMTDWVLYVYDEYYDLSGIADNHPSIGKNSYVSHTSRLVDYSFKDDKLIYETRNTVYICPLKYMNTWPYRTVVSTRIKELTHRADSSESILDKIISATAKLSILERQQGHTNQEEWLKEYYGDIYDEIKDYSNDEFLNHIRELQKTGQAEIAELMQKESERLINIACNYKDCVCIEVSNVGCGNTLAYHIGDHKGVVYPRVNSGMFQDSVLYIKPKREDDQCSLDFRYWPRGPIGWGDWMETYSWSDNIKKAVIKNDTNSSLRFNKTEIPAGETMVFTPAEHRQGLISPDFHNGKSLFVKSEKHSIESPTDEQ